MNKEETLLYDVVSDYIISEGFASDTDGTNEIILKLSDETLEEIYERTMTTKEKSKEGRLKDKYDDSSMKKNMQDQYGKEEGKKVYFATIRKQAMKSEGYRVLASSDGQEKPSQFAYKDEKTAKKYADSIKKGGGKATVTKEEVKMTKKAYNKLHKDFKSDDPKNPRTTKYNPKTGGTESHPVKFVDEEKKSCGEGEYFCNDEQKCKPMPEGHHVMPDGKLMKGEKHSVKEAAAPAGQVPDKSADALKKRQSMIKKQVLMKKLQALRQGGGEDVVAHNELKGDIINELNRYGKETGKATGSMNKRPGSPVKKGGSGKTAINVVRGKIRQETGKPEGQRKKVKGAKDTSAAGKYIEKLRSKKAYAAKAKKAGFKSTQDYTDTVARYGSEDNYKKGKGLGT